MVRAGQFAQVMRQLAFIAIALLLPHLAVSRAEIGNWEQFQYLGFLLGFAWLTGIGQAYLRQVRGLDAANAAHLTRSLLKIILAITLLLVGVLLLFQRPTLALLAGGAALPGWSLYLLFLLTHWPGLIYEQVLLARKKARKLMWFSLLGNGSLLLAILLPLVLGMSWSESLPWLLAVSLIKGLLMLDKDSWGFTDTQQIATTSDVKWMALLKASGYFVAYAALGAFIVSFDPWLVNYWYQGDESTFAIYRYGTRELPLIMAVTNGVGAAVLPQIAEDRPAALTQLKASSLRLMHLFFPFAFLLLLSSPWWWEWVFTARFAESLPLFQLFLFVGISRFMMSIVLLTGTGHGKALVGLGIIELVLNAIFSIWLVSWLGLMGIVWATIIAYTLDRILACAYLYHKEGIPLSDYCNWPWLLGYTCLLILGYTIV